MDRQDLDREFGNHEAESNYDWVGIAITISVTISILWLMGFNKYEGRSAREWFEAYDNELIVHERLKDCIEEYPNTTYEDCL